MRGELYAHELVTVPVGTVGEYLDALAVEGAARGRGARPRGRRRLPGGHGQRLRGRSCIWAIPDWATWTRFEQAWSPAGELAAWRKTTLGLQADWRRILLIDSPLSPLRIGRQPEESDRLPLDQVR